MKSKTTKKVTLPTLYHSPGESSSQRRNSTFGEAWIRLQSFLSQKAPKTVETYKGILEEWCSFLGVPIHDSKDDAVKGMLEASDLHASAYRVWLHDRPGERPRAEKKESTSVKSLMRQKEFSKREKKTGLEATLSNATISKKFAALRRMYRVLVAADLIRINPFDSDRVAPPPKDAGRKRPTEMFDFSTVFEMIDAIDISTPKGCRDRAILSVLFGGGLRRSEVVALRVGDFKKSQKGTGYLYLRSTKAKKDAQQALPQWAAKAVEVVCAARKKEGAGDADFLFIGYTGRGGVSPTTSPVSSSGIYKLFIRYCRLAGIHGHLTPHSARATAITRLLDKGVPHRLVQEFSRHASIQMVEVYDKRRIGVDENPGSDLDY